MSYQDILDKWSAMGLKLPPGPPIPEVKAKTPRTKAIAKPTITTYKLDDTPRYNLKWHRGSSSGTPPPSITALYYYYIFF